MHEMHETTETRPKRTKAEIARENGRKSNGAVTPEGKQRAATASIVHGLASKAVVLANECPNKYAYLRRSFYDEWQPTTPTEAGYVDQITNSYWRLCRAWALETSLLDSGIFGKRAEIDSVYTTVTPAMRASDAIGGLNLANKANLETIQRYEGMYERSYDRAIDRLIKLRKLRGVEVFPEPRTRSSAMSLSPDPITIDPLPPLDPVTATATPTPESPSLRFQSLAFLYIWLQTLIAAVLAFLQAATHKLRAKIRFAALRRAGRRKERKGSQRLLTIFGIPEEFCLQPLNPEAFFDEHSGTFTYPERLNYNSIYSGPTYQEIMKIINGEEDE
ncbi:MAG: hypothetical protein JNL98_37165 [Bryobacterales bacterium]|nr:hypothetical protein [Bryobacterales bacterium]